VGALEQAAGRGVQAAQALSAALRAAAAGLEATRWMQARVGRARYLGPRAVGHPDAGAASIVLIFQTLASLAEG
jgi:dihydroxyacetone kinase